MSTTVVVIVYFSLEKEGVSISGTDEYAVLNRSVTLIHVKYPQNF